MALQFSHKDPLHIVVTLILVWYVLKLFIFVAPLILKPWLALNISKKFGGTWALVTGGSDGIGKAYAQQLARKGLNVVLVSNDQEQLRKVSEAIKNECPKSRVATIAVDFVKEDVRDYRRKIQQGIKDLEIAVLVNNVGMIHDIGKFLDIHVEPDMIAQDLIKCNLTSMNVVTALVLPQMVKRKCGLIINMSSISTIMTPPMIAVYTATKAYGNAFSQIIRQEYQQYNIIVQTVMPGRVVTNLSKAKKSFTVPTPEEFVSSALGKIGVYHTTHGYWVHSLMGFFITDIFPRWLVEYWTSVQVASIIKSR